MTPKCRKRLLWLLIPVFGSSIVGSLIATELNGNIGKINFKHSHEKNSGKFINSGKNGTDSNGFTPVKLVSELAKDPNSVPLLMRGFATQVSKHIFDGSLFKNKKYIQVKQHFNSHLGAIKARTEGLIKQKRKDSTRVKKNWASDEERYLSALESFVLGKIDLMSIDSYYTLKEHDFSSITKVQGSKNVFSFIGFLMSRWIKEVKAGNYVHHILPYAESFQDSTRELYTKKFTNITLPNKPNFYFPDFDPSRIEEFTNTINLFFGGTDNSWLDLLGTHEEKNKQLTKEKSTIKWSSSTNTPQTNLVLQYLSQDSNNENGGTGSSVWSLFTSFWRPTLQYLGLGQNTCQNSPDKITTLSRLSLDLKKDPLKLFCISGAGNDAASVEFVIHAKDKSKTEQIVFWRDTQGFNVLFPSKVASDNKNPRINDNFHKSKTQMVDEFKDYIKKNFSYLLLQYYLYIHQNKGKKQVKEPCCCKEIIESLVKLWKLNRELTELNENLKIWDIRSRNNDFFRVVDYSEGGANYLHKLGTVDANPPGFLKELTKSTELKKISSSVDGHLKKIGDYFEKKAEGAQNQGKKSESSELKGTENKGSGQHEGSNYWSFEDEKKSKDCMKRPVAEILLEKISTMDLLKKTLLLPFSFEKISELLRPNANGSQPSDSSNPLSSLEQSLKEDYNGFFNFASASSGRKKREAPSPQDSSDKKLIEMLQKAIKEELSVSQISSVSDALLYKLSSENGSQERQPSTSTDNFENIKNLLTISNLSKQPLKTANTLEIAQLRSLITSLYLLDDSLKEYRELLKSIIKDQLFGGYAFSLSWSKFCTQTDSKNPIDPNQNQSEGGNGGSGGSNENQSFWSPISTAAAKKQEPSTNNGKEWEKDKLDPRKCIRTPDRYSISSIKKVSSGTPAKTISSPSSSAESTIQLMGYKGSLTRNSQIQLPGDLYDKIVAFLIKEGYISWSKIEEQIELIKSNRQLYSFIKQLSKVNSAIGGAFELPDLKHLKEDMDQSKRAEILEWFGLTKNKDLLKEFIKKHITKNGNGAQLTQASSGTTTSTANPKDKGNFSGLMWDTTSTETQDQTKQYVFSTKEANEGSAAVYLIQYNADDVSSKKKFAKFLKDKLTPDALIKDIVKKSQDPGLQAKAINHYLMRGNYAGGKVYNLTSDDYYLKDQFSSIIL